MVDHYILISKSNNLYPGENNKKEIVKKKINVGITWPFTVYSDSRLGSIFGNIMLLNQYHQTPFNTITTTGL